MGWFRKSSTAEASSSSSSDENNKNNKEPLPPMKWADDPEMNAGLISGVLFLWLQPLFSRAALLHKNNRALEQEDLAPLPLMDQGKSVEERFETAYNAWTPSAKLAAKDQETQLRARLVHSLAAVCKQRLITAGIIKFCNTSLQFTFPILLNEILKFFEESLKGEIPQDASGGQRYKGYWLSCILMFFIACKAVTESAYFHKVNRSGFQVKTAVSASIYRKSLRLAASEQHRTTLGEMVNLMQVDATKMEAFVPQIHVIWDGIYQIAGYMVILGRLLGWPCVMGLIVMMCAGPVMGKIMGRLFMINRSMVKYTDDRVKTVNEALQAALTVKMYTWEDSFKKEIGKSRQQELDCLRTVAYLRGFSRSYMTALPTVAAVVTFLAYAYGTDNEVTASTLFSALAAFDQLRFPLLFYPLALAQLAQARVSVSRVAIFLGMGEVKEQGYTRLEQDGGVGEITIENATVYWSDPKTPLTKEEADDMSLDKSQHTNRTDPSSGELVYPSPVVHDLSMSVKQGELCAIVGRVGSGKSTLCAAILNETILADDSKITLRGRVAYVSQTAWIMNKTVRDNIIFGQPFDEERYQRVLDSCQLTHDLEMLDDGDLTEIGERGINLSGGQKQRLSCARAAYSDADVIIFDDPLSALDPEVAGKLFDECIIDFLSEKTRILVTNQLQCLPKCDMILALANGRVLEQGSYSDLMADEDGEIQRLLTDLKESTKCDEDEDAEKKGKASTGVSKAKLIDAVVVEKSTSNKDPNKVKLLTTKEEREQGAVKFGVYLKYLMTGGGYLKFAFVYATFVLCAGVNLMVTVWISLWTSDTSYENHSQGFYLGWYAATAVMLGLFTFARSYMMANFGIQASNVLHKNLLKSVLHAPMRFFDTTPTGRILSRFSKDMHTIDQELSDFFDFVLFISLSVVITLAAIVYATPWFGVAILPLMFVYFRFLNYFREVSRETKRLESLSRSPVYAHFSETLGGLSTIRAYGQAITFMHDFESKLDGSTQAFYCNKTADRWLSVRLELIGATIAGLAAIFSTQVVVANSTAGVPETDGFASLAGLSLTYAISITGSLNWVVRSFAQVEAAMNSCERVFYYSENIPQEAAFTSDELERDAASGNSATKACPSTVAVVAAGGKAAHPSGEWPVSGAINLQNLLMRYRPETPLVLKGLNVSIAGGERIGVVGRTGSGKSSLLLTLMRIVEPELAEGDQYQAPLTIDGVDALRIGLKELRSQIAVIPQSPVLFSGTIRSNMDPFNDYSNEEIWSALEQCSMKQAVEVMNDELDEKVAEYGENLSQGQRQLLCLGRAILRKSKILLLDEATSSVDYETDRGIQRTIREAFAGSTVLTIAHRVNTIMDSDKILVMKDGQAAEFAPPAELLSDEDSLFSEIVRHSKAENN